MRSSTVCPSGPQSRSHLPWRTVGIGAALVACVLSVCSAAATNRASAAASASPYTSAATSASPYTITLAQTVGLTDGATDPVEVTSSDPASSPVGYVDIEICKPGPSYTTFTAVKVFGQCGFSPGSSAYRSPSGSATQDFPGEPSGARSFPDQFVAGVGSATYEGNMLNCNSTHPCDLVVSVFKSQTDFVNETSVVTKAFKLTFLPFGKVDGCSGTAADAIQTVSSDRLVDAYTDWSKQACVSKDGPDGKDSATENTFIGEGGAIGAVAAFSGGDADLAYAAGGYDLPGFAETTGRPYVAVPIALNAVVVAASGGQVVKGYSPKNNPTTASVPFSDLKITAGEAASLFGGGHLSTAETTAVDKENPEFNNEASLVPYSAPGGASFTYPEAIAGVDSTTDFATSYFTNLAKAEWNSGPNVAQGSKADQPRGVFSSFGQPGTSEAPFTSAGLYSARTDLEKATLPYVGIGPLPLWVLSDRATASELGFTVASLDSGSSNAYVPPTKASMDAAVADMTKEPDGTLQPDVVAAAESKTAYPLTFVEYALAPTEPLVDAGCHPRTTSEQLMVKWLKFLTGSGQAGLAPGLEPITAGLRSQAAAAIAKIGTAAQTGACAPTTTTTTTTTPVGTTTTPTPPVTPAPPAATTPTATPAPAGTDAGSKSAPTTTPVSTPATTVPTGSTGKHRLAAVDIPQLPGPQSTSWTIPSLALAALALLAGGLALRSAGRSPALLLRTAVGRMRGRKGRP